MAFSCLLYGLRVQSDLDLGLPSAPCGTPDIVIRLGPARALAVRPVRPGCFEVRPRHVFIGTPGGGVVMSRDGQEMWVEPGPGMAPATMVPAVLGQGLAALLHQRGTPTLRASAVSFPAGAAVAFMGGAGAGKSSLAAALVQRGATLMADDVLPVDGLGADAPSVSPGAAFCALPTDALLALGGSPHGLDDAGCADVLWRWPAAVARASAPLQAIYVLGRASAPRIERLSIADAFEAIARHSFSGTLALASGSVPATLGWFAALLRSVPVYRLSLPPAVGRLDEAADFVAAHAGAPTHAGGQVAPVC